MCMSATALGAPPGEFESFVQTRTVPLLRAAYLLTGDQHLAEDLVQTALARTHRAWSNLHATGSADAYTRKTMYHLQVSWWRRRRIAETLTSELPAYAPSPTDEAESAALQLTLRSVLLRLPPRQRAVLALRFFEDLTEAQTATVLGVTVGTVKSQTAKALTKLRLLAPELREFYSGAVDELRPVDLRAPAPAGSRPPAARAVVASTVLAAVLGMTLATAVTLLAGRDGGRSTPVISPSLTVSPSMTLLSSPNHG
jgi:RNA polymerase sigma-70 factor (sigma-E family)